MYMGIGITVKFMRQPEQKRLHFSGLCGFTLVELAIVLVIIGLIIGGILVGRDMVASARLKSIYRDVNSFQAATNTFKMKYNLLPGDGIGATNFFGKDNTNCPSASGLVATNGTCDGNNNGQIDSDTEGLRFWQQLSLAGMIAGEYPGTGTLQPGINLPRTTFDAVGYHVRYQDYGMSYGNGYGSIPDSDGMKNRFAIGVSTGGSLTKGFLRTEEAYAFDLKYDDGNPAIGMMTTNPVGSGNQCVLVPASALGAYYNLNLGTPTFCAITMKAGF